LRAKVLRVQCAVAAISGNLPGIAVFFAWRVNMKAFLRLGVALLALALLVIAGTGSAAAECITKGGKGTAGSVDGAKFQAWEAVLQATDWGSWAAFMAGGGKVPTAPGYKVSAVKSRCQPGELGHVCTMQARLCK
jgi:hypothetical protein